MFRKVGGAWTFEAALAPAAGAAGDHFGWSGAVWGDVAFVCAPDTDDVVAKSGAAYVFERSGTSWVESARLVAADAGAFDQFGWSVALEQDTAVVAAWHDDDLGTNSGSLYVFDRLPGGWTETAKLTASDGQAFDRLGYAVALDGDRLLAGAHEDDDLGPEAGSAYVFERQPGGWVEDAKLLASDGSDFDRFGRDVALEGDRAVVGAPRYDGALSNAGGAYVFERQPGGWVETAILVAADAGEEDEAGQAVALSQGRVLVAAWKDDDLGTNSGSAALWRLPELGCLSADVPGVSLATGGVQNLALDAGLQHAGLPYVLLGGLTGTAPGFPVDQVFLALNVDSYTLLTLMAPNTPPLAGSAGSLDPQGTAAASFTLPVGLPPSLLGTVLHHAYVVLELQPTLLQAVAGSNAVALAVEL